ncbi:MAG: esterase-like activity of phytase family protein [Parvibaculum sp.]|uniref:esterase-like activity of phytase family protein n=1 Tax=Parvibaculum sp. TaxID=2024848 RepID=UPI002ABAD6F7|nr:esterase-like activity of phytase family protein [Parvibaculum sp.]MDZ4381955.1 esterase-like activity of phytase family protein [Parvibaculum sp.]
MAIRYGATSVLAACLLTAICTAPSPLAAASRPVEVSTSTLLWNPEDRTESRTGKLVWAGGIEIASPDEDFGGWSGLAVSSDGAALLSISDQGRWLTAILLYDERGRLSGMAEAKIAPMLGLDGKPIAGKTLGDAESLVMLPGMAGGILGKAYVGFERAHRIWRYDLETSGAEAIPEQLLTQRHFGLLNNNGGLESLDLLPPPVPGGEPRILAIAEDTRDPRGHIKGFIADGHHIAWFGLRAHEPYRPTDMARLPNGDLLLLERRYSPLAGAGMQMRLIPADAIARDAVVDGDVLIDVGQRYSIDNMEGLAVRQDKNGDLLVYVISDDNFSPLQRTLLLMFRLEMPAKPQLAPAAETLKLPRSPEADGSSAAASGSEEAAPEPR